MSVTCIKRYSCLGVDLFWGGEGVRAIFLGMNLFLTFRLCMICLVGNSLCKKFLI